MATSSVLYAAAKEIGSTCDDQNRAFLLCKASDQDPAACLDKGEAVQACALGVLKSAMAMCEDTFQKYATCLDSQISQEYMFERCRKHEDAFTECRANAKTPSAVASASVTAASATESTGATAKAVPTADKQTAPSTT